MAADEFVADHLAQPVAGRAFAVQPFEVLLGDRRQAAAFVFAPRHDGGADRPARGLRVDVERGLCARFLHDLAHVVLVPIQCFRHALLLYPRSGVPC